MLWSYTPLTPLLKSRVTQSRPEEACLFALESRDSYAYKFLNRIVAVTIILLALDTDK
jgi:hypothetical protein